MTEYMEKVALQQVAFDMATEQAIFKKSFLILWKTLGGNAFTGFGPKLKPNSKLLSYHYEAFTLGIQKHLGAIDASNPSQIKRLGTAMSLLKKDPEFIDLTTGGGKNYARPLAKRITMVQSVVESAL